MTARFLNRWAEAITGAPQSKPFQTKGLAFAHARRVAREINGVVSVQRQVPVSPTSPNWSVEETWEFHADGRQKRITKEPVP